MAGKTPAPVTIAQVAKEYDRYEVEAYYFVFEALEYALKKIGARRHLTGNQLCEYIRDLAREQFGPMARTVFAQWRVRTTDDFGQIVYHLIEKQLMSKTETDSIDDFHNVYDFHEAFDEW